MQLDKRGVLDQLKAQIRAEIFKTLDDEVWLPRIGVFWFAPDLLLLRILALNRATRTSLSTS